jgi:Zn-dependent protease
VNPSFEIARIAGIRIGLNWSWAIVFVLITWSLASAVFPAQNPGLSDGEYLGMALVAAGLFFCSILLHELGHAFQARREGMEIDGITLWLFGGVARFRGDFPSAGAEFRIAVAGPLVSLVLGVLFVAVAVAVDMSAAVDGVAAWLGYINLSLLVFNLLPALPLDGGRVLRAALWAARGDFAWATAVAADVGRFFGYLMIGGGILLFIVEGAFSGAWLAFLGWFLLAAAASEARYVAVRQALDGLKVRHLMVPQPVTAHPDRTLGELMDGLAGVARYTAYPVMRDGEVLGVLPLSRVLDTPRSEWDARRVSERMLGLDEVPLLTEDEDAIDALSKLTEGNLHRGLVLDEDRLAGFLSITDIARLLQGRRPRRPAAPAR